MRLKNTIGIIGLGYVGLPLALEFSKKFQVVAFDKNVSRIKELKKKIDRNNEIKKKYLTPRSLLKFTNKKEDLSICNVFIITVPTPIKLRNLPDLNQLKEACILGGKYIKRNSIVILEKSTWRVIARKQLLPTYDIFDEKRYYRSSEKSSVFK